MQIDSFPSPVICDSALFLRSTPDDFDVDGLRITLLRSLLYPDGLHFLIFPFIPYITAAQRPSPCSTEAFSPICSMNFSIWRGTLSFLLYLASLWHLTLLIKPSLWEFQSLLIFLLFLLFLLFSYSCVRFFLLMNSQDFHHFLSIFYPIPWLYLQLICCRSKSFIRFTSESLDVVDLNLYLLSRAHS